MNERNQYHEDSELLSDLIQRFTGIPAERTLQFILDNGAAELLSCANILCETEVQRERLRAFFEFKSAYERVKSAEKQRSYSINSPEKSKDYFRALFGDANDKERLAVAFLDVRSQLIAAKTMFAGTIDSAEVSPREIVKEALFQNASGVILGHNHPSGNMRPSDDDIRITGKVETALGTVGIRLVDHIIVGRGSALSLREVGLREGEAATGSSAVVSRLRRAASDHDEIDKQLTLGPTTLNN